MARSAIRLTTSAPDFAALHLFYRFPSRTGSRPSFHEDMNVDLADRLKPVEPVNAPIGFHFGRQVAIPAGDDQPSRWTRSKFQGRSYVATALDARYA